jgi:peptidoglycan/xylan/chitin deacetylase (PgdA/CDA1 family)
MKSNSSPVHHGDLFPNAAAGAVSLTYDDALNVHLDQAMPDLEACGLRGTFYIPTRQHPGDSWHQRPAEWKAAGGRGHEIGNHTSYHPCARSYPWVPKGRALEDYDLARIEAELHEAAGDLEAVMGAQEAVSFAYTCCQDWVGPEHTSFRPVTAKLFPASRGGGNQLANPLQDDLAFIPSLAIVESMPLSDILAFIDSAATQPGWAVLMFHGVGGEHNMNCPREMHQAICRHVQSRREALWCDSFVNVALRIRQATGRPWVGA